MPAPTSPHTPSSSPVGTVRMMLFRASRAGTGASSDERGPSAARSGLGRAGTLATTDPLLGAVQDIESSASSGAGLAPATGLAAASARPNGSSPVPPLPQSKSAPRNATATPGGTSPSPLPFVACDGGGGSGRARKASRRRIDATSSAPTSTAFVKNRPTYRWGRRSSESTQKTLAVLRAWPCR